MALAQIRTVVLGSLAFLVFWVLAVFPSFKVLPVGRTAGAIVGAVLMVVFQVDSPSQAYGSVDLPILGLLFGTMVVSVYLERADMFRYLGGALSWKSGGGKDLMCRVCVLSAISSALFTNDTSCVVLTGFVLKLCKQKNLPPKPFLIALATSANIGSTATPIGNPQNLIIAVQSNISFGKFLLGLLPSMLLGVLVNTLLLLVIYWKQLSPTAGVEEKAGISGLAGEGNAQASAPPFDLESLGGETASAEGRFESYASPALGDTSPAIGPPMAEHTEENKNDSVPDADLTQPQPSSAGVMSGGRLHGPPMAEHTDESENDAVPDADLTQPQPSSSGVVNGGRLHGQGSSDEGEEFVPSLPVFHKSPTVKTDREITRSRSYTTSPSIRSEPSPSFSVEIPVEKTSVAAEKTSFCVEKTTDDPKWKRTVWKISVYLMTAGMLAALLYGLDLSWSAITAATALMVLDFQDAGPSLDKVSYSLLVFFAGMFITVDGFNRTGIPGTFWDAVEPHARINSASGIAVLTLVVIVLSNVASNVPTVLLLGSRVSASAAANGSSVTRSWLILAWASTIAGNLTLVGSAANLIVSEQARNAQVLRYDLTFWNHLMFGVPSTFIVATVGLPLIRG